jgi:integrase
MASWRKGTQKQYQSYLLRWEEYCNRKNIAPHTPGNTAAIEFLTELYNSGVGYSAINTARSALSSVIRPTAGVPFGKDPLVCRFLKGVFELKPSLPKYSEIWDVNKVLCYLQQVSSVNQISLKDLTMNLSTLLCLLTGQRCQTIHKININFIQFMADRCIITIREVLKHTKAGKHQAPLELCAYPNDKRICVLEYLQEYIKRTATLRGDEKQLLVSFVKPHKAVTKDSIARWVKSILKQAGIDTDKFTCHSTRAASTSCVKAAGLNLPQIMQSAGWSNSSTFAKFYDKNIETENFGSIVLNSL